MPRIGVKGLVNSNKSVIGQVDVVSIAVLDWLFAQIENAMNGQLDSSNIAASGIGTAQIADSSIVPSKIFPGSLTATQMADGVGQAMSGSYTGDGTANRVISVADAQGIAFTPRHVLAIRADATFIEFQSIQAAGVTTNWYRDSAGAMASLATNWQGVVANGFKLGSSVAATSNVTGVTYRFVAFK
jgi:hypothetical protein